MLAMLLAAHLAVPLAVAPASPAAGAVAAQDTAREAEDVADDALAELDDAVEARRPDAVRAALGRLDEVYEDLSERTAKKIGKAVVALFKDYQPREETVDVDPVTRESRVESDREEVESCYLMAVGLVFDRPGGDEVLAKVLKAEVVRASPGVRAAVVEALGYRTDPQLLARLVEYLDDESPDVARAAVASIGRLRDAPAAARAEAVDELLDVYADVVRDADTELRRKRPDGEPGAAEVRLARLATPLDEALAELTRQRLAGLEAWRAWRDEHPDEEDW